MPRVKATAGQISTIKSLVNERELEPGFDKRIYAALQRGVSGVDAKKFISLLLKAPRRVELDPLRPGLYEFEGLTYRVKISEKSGFPYAQQVVEEDGKRINKYARGVIFQLRAEMRIKEETL